MLVMGANWLRTRVMTASALTELERYAANRGMRG